jgi:galactose-1-phosphate uridylyltransferase
MNTEKTIFEKIIDNEVPSKMICDNDDFSAFLDAFPTNPGHTLVVTKTPYKDIHEIPDEILSQMILFIKKLSKIIPRFDGDSWPKKYEYKEGEATEIANKINAELSS